MKYISSCINISFVGLSFVKSLLFTQRYNSNININNKYPLSRPYYKKYIQRMNSNDSNDILSNFFQKKNNKYPHSSVYYENFVKRLNSKNISQEINELFDNFTSSEMNQQKQNINKVRIIINKKYVNKLFDDFQNQQNYDEEDNEEEDEDDYDELDYDFYEKARQNVFYKKEQKEQRDQRDQREQKDNKRDQKEKVVKKSEHFEVIIDLNTNFTDVGGYYSIKKELEQCVDLLRNYTKYSKFNVRVPKGLIFEGPPGNGKTLLAKALAGEAKTGFIAVSGSQFQEMYIGVGSARIRELFQLAEKNIPCIIFIDEIDALGRNRGSDKESSSAERDSTLNELLVALDGFKTKSGIFLIGATNRADLLDPALLRPGRIDKRVYIGNPDEIARNAIINIHSKGKPRDETILTEHLIEITNGFSAAQIENLLNEAMLNALRDNREIFTQNDLDIVYNKVLVGWQPTEHIFTEEMLDKICIHEMGHAIVGLLAHNHSKVKKVIINLSSPNSPGYTLFEKSNYNIYNRDTLFEHLMILLGGRIAEELFYGHLGVSTGAISDFEEALTLANKMITYYGMGKMAIYPNNSEKYKELIDNEITNLLDEAYTYASIIIDNSKEYIYNCAMLLKEKRVLTLDELLQLWEKWNNNNN
jgi:ATP-dependent metalloprotease FtsH